jgi:hypothetical protein
LNIHGWIRKKKKDTRLKLKNREVIGTKIIFKAKINKDILNYISGEGLFSSLKQNIIFEVKVILRKSIFCF